MKRNGTALDAVEAVIRALEGSGLFNAGTGALVLAPDGRFAIRHTTPTMCTGYWTGKGTPVAGDRFP